jgi:hypothetical protein
VVEFAQPGKNAALNFGLDSTDSDVVISVDGDVTFSTDCFWRVLKSFDYPEVMVSGAQPESLISPSLRQTQLGQLYRVRQLRRQVVGGRLLPMGRMIAHRRGAFRRYSLEYLGAEDTWMPFEVVRRHDWQAVTLVEEATVFALPPQNWLDLLRQESRWERNVSRMPQHFTELQPIAREFAERMAKLRALTPAKRRQLLALMEREQIGAEVLELDETLWPQMLRENATGMKPAPTLADGTWDMQASTKAYMPLENVWPK